mmetsp:Transcript_29476/g.56999  ORF Transcript_29476/g.56999 Transcript_29476/m.56999 type:complete len:213 (-) Transcript_29476:221-859(-)|eukprot:2821896-Pleurochrysis_carterae.AAC.2
MELRRAGLLAACQWEDSRTRNRQSCAGEWTESTSHFQSVDQLCWRPWIQMQICWCLSTQLRIYSSEAATPASSVPRVDDLRQTSPSFYGCMHEPQLLPVVEREILLKSVFAALSPEKVGDIQNLRGCHQSQPLKGRRRASCAGFGSRLSLASEVTARAAMHAPREKVRTTQSILCGDYTLLLPSAPLPSPTHRGFQVHLNLLQTWQWVPPSL